MDTFSNYVTIIVLIRAGKEELIIVLFVIFVNSKILIYHMLLHS